jgi:iron(III) transport system ATP-binding protein
VSDLTLTGITRSYGETRVLHGVNLHVPAGSFTAILGPSGCGKTTLLRLIGGFDRPDAGCIRLGDQVLYENGRSVPPERRRIGYVAQEGALFPHLTVADNVGFGLRGDRRQKQARVEELLKTVGLPDAALARRFPHELSGGQQQRVALARALAPGPRVILLDEPFASLDASLRENTRRAVAASLAAAGATTILVTHDQAEALSLADQVAVMRQGRLVQVAAPSDLYRQPVDAETAVSVGEAVILPATVRDGGAECALGTIVLRAAVPTGTAEVMVRPEQIAIVDLDAEPDSGRPEGVPARVLDVSYFGHDALVRLELEDGPVVTARPPGFAAPRAGAEVRLVVRGPVHAFTG